MTATAVPKALKFMRGIGALSTMQNAVKSCISPEIDVGSTGVTQTVELFKVFPGLTVVDIQPRVVTAFTSTGAMGLILGDSDDTDRFLTSDHFTDTVGLKGANKNLGFTYQTSDPTVINATLTAAAHFDSGKFRAVLYYTEEDV